MTLHITNGDSAASLIEASGVSGRVLPWRDVLHEGPVPAGLTDDELRPVRAGFLASRGWGEYRQTLDDFATRDRSLTSEAARAEVVLWFEHDLYDQLQLLQVLDRLAGLDDREDRVNLICINAFPGKERFGGLGELSPAELETLYPGRRPVAGATFARAREGWKAFRSADPSGIESVIRRQDEAGLPFLGAALTRHLEEYPSTENGLSRTEQSVLERLRDGPVHWIDLFARNAEGEEAAYLGDTTFRAIVDRLSRGPCPLVRWSDQAVELTADGRLVLSGGADAVRLNGIDRWLGGVHLAGDEAAWRWDPGRRAIIESRSS